MSTIMLITEHANVLCNVACDGVAWRVSALDALNHNQTASGDSLKEALFKLRRRLELAFHEADRRRAIRFIDHRHTEVPDHGSE